MPRYKLRPPQAGDFLYGDGDTAVVADTIEQARAFWRDDYDEDAIYLHSYIGRCRVVYKADVENGDAHEDAEPGDTTIDYIRDDGRELRPGEVRVWMLGPPRRNWRMEPMPPEPLEWCDLPDGILAYHKVLGFGTLYAPPRLWRASRRPIFPVQFESGERRDLFLGAITFHYDVRYGATCPPPPTRYRLTVEGDVLAEGVTEDAARALRDARIARLDDEWKAEQFAAYEAAAA